MKVPDGTGKSLKIQDSLGMSDDLAEAAPTLLFPASTANKEMSRLLRQVVTSIAHYTDYQIVAGILLEDSSRAKPRNVVCSPNVPIEIGAFLTDLIFSADELKN